MATQLFFATAESTFPFKTRSFSRVALSGFPDGQDAVSQIIATILASSDMIEAARREGVMQLRVLTCWRQLVIGQLLLVHKHI